MYEMNYGESRRPRSNEKWMGTFKPNNSLASLSDDWPISRGDSLVCLPMGSKYGCLSDSFLFPKLTCIDIWIHEKKMGFLH